MITEKRLLLGTFSIHKAREIVKIIKPGMKKGYRLVLRGRGSRYVNGETDNLLQSCLPLTIAPRAAIYLSKKEKVNENRSTCTCSWRSICKNKR